MKKSQSGFTLPEFLVILALIALLLIIFAVMMQNRYLPRAADARRKSDLEKIAVAFEDYYNDKGCYPDKTILNRCNSEDMKPYLGKIPCDPTDHQPYYYEPDSKNQCKGYRLLAQLRYTQDPAIKDMPCYPPYNYGVSTGIKLIPDDCTPVAAPTPSDQPIGPFPSPTPGYFGGKYACDPRGQCNAYENAMGKGCPTTFNTIPECNAGCKNAVNWCTQ